MEDAKCTHKNDDKDLISQQFYRLFSWQIDSKGEQLSTLKNSHSCTHIPLMTQIKEKNTQTEVPLSKSPHLFGCCPKSFCPPSPFMSFGALFPTKHPGNPFHAVKVMTIQSLPGPIRPTSIYTYPLSPPPRPCINGQFPNRRGDI